jgi:hypothetical protein
MSAPTRSWILLALCLALALGACSRRPRSTAEVPRSLPAAFAVTVAPFTQPINASQLIVGRIPENQGRITPEDLEALNLQLRHILTAESKRQYAFITEQELPADVTTFHSSEQPQALPRWIAYGKKRGVHYLLVPQVLDWHQREGSKAGVTRAAHVRVEFFLLRVAEGEVASHSVYEEQQVGLADNLLNMGAFIQRCGQWVTAEALAAEGMRKAVKDMGL